MPRLIFGDPVEPPVTGIRFDVDQLISTSDLRKVLDAAEAKAADDKDTEVAEVQFTRAPGGQWYDWQLTVS